MKKQLLFLVMTLIPMLASADAVEIDGIYYLLNNETCEATVTYFTDPFSGDGRTPNSMTYQGDVEIPNFVYYNGKKYDVICIGRCAFMNSQQLTSVTIPSSVLSIKEESFTRSSIREVVIGENVKEVLHAFNECERLHEISFPNSVEIFEGSFIHGNLTKVSLGTGIKNLGAYDFAYCPLQDFYCFSKNPPTADDKTFYFANIWKATLHVPQETIEVYKTTSPWKDFGNIVAISNEKPGENTSKICKRPKIHYNSGKITFESETANAEFVSKITDDDVKSYYGESIDLNLTYTITVYAFAEGYENSDEVSAKLCWIDQLPQTEGITNDITQFSSSVVMIQSEGGMLTIQGADDGTPIGVYSVNGTKVGSAVSSNGQATVSTTLQSGSVAIVRIRDRCIKVVVR